MFLERITFGRRRTEQKSSKIRMNGVCENIEYCLADDEAFWSDQMLQLQLEIWWIRIYFYNLLPPKANTYTVAPEFGSSAK